MIFEVGDPNSPTNDIFKKTKAIGSQYLELPDHSKMIFLKFNMEKAFYANILFCAC